MNGRATQVARLDNVSHHYGAICALNAITLDVPSGRTVGLIGPDGVGKSSLLGIIAGSRRIQTGQVRVLDGDMADARHRHEACSRIAYMPQGLGKNLYPDLSVRENIEFFSRLFGQPRHEREWRIAELLDSTGLAPFPDRPAKKLSGGMRQKLGLCCALIHDPDLLILDEPTTGVDPLSRRQFWDLIERMHARRPEMSIIIATAYMEEAERFDWLIAMDGGTVLAQGSPGDIKSETNTRTIEAAFIALLPEQRRAKRSSHSPSDSRRPPDGDHSNGSDLPFRRLHRCGWGELQHRAGRDLRISGAKRLRKNHDDEDAHRVAARDGGQSVSARRADRCHRSERTQPRRLHVAVVLALYRAHGPPEPHPACASFPPLTSPGEVAHRRAGAGFWPRALS